MNGQRLVQEQKGPEWATLKVSKAGQLKPGIYHVSAAKDADSTLQHTGVVFHADDRYVYQKDETQGIVRHPVTAFRAVPEYGRPVSIIYQKGRALTRDLAWSQGRKLSR